MNFFLNENQLHITYDKYYEIIINLNKLSIKELIIDDFSSKVEEKFYPEDMAKLMIANIIDEMKMLIKNQLINSFFDDIVDHLLNEDEKDEKTIFSLVIFLELI